MGFRLTDRGVAASVRGVVVTRVVMKTMGWQWAVAIGAMAAAMAIVGCGSEELAPPQGMVGGVVLYGGPVVGAAVEIWQRNRETGERWEEVVATGTTGDKGQFELPIGDYSGTLEIVARGGLTTELATGELLTLDDTYVLRSVLIDAAIGGDTRVTVSPVTELAVAWAEARRALHKAGAAGYAESVTQAYEFLGTHFFGGEYADPSRVRPADVVTTDPTSGASPTAEVRYAIALCGWSELAWIIARTSHLSSQEVSTPLLLERWKADLTSMADMAIFDGVGDSGDALLLGACQRNQGCEGPTDGCETICDLTANTPRSKLASAIRQWLASDRNHSGLQFDSLRSRIAFISGNPEPELFGGAPAESLDDLPPTIMFDEPDEGTWVRGVVELRAHATDDVTMPPTIRWTEPAALVGVDGDTGPGAVTANLDTIAAGLEDGPLRIQAEAVDESDNTGVGEITLLLDNTAPVLSAFEGGFHVDGGGTWWTAEAGPSLSGTVADAAPVTVSVAVNGAVVGTVELAMFETAWSITLPADALDPGSNAVQIRATDVAGNTSTVDRTVALDPTPPVVEPEATFVLDERNDQITFASSGAPAHVHQGSPVELGIATVCNFNNGPQVWKHSHLLDATVPAGTSENAANPIRLAFRLTDPGVGVDPASASYRVRRVTGTWPTEWTAAHPAGGSDYDLTLYRNAPAGTPTVPPFQTEEGGYEVQLRGRDWLGRETIETRCFLLRLMGAPLKVGNAAVLTAADTAFSALKSYDLNTGSSANDPVSELLNVTAAGAGLMKVPITNGTPEPVYLTLTPDLTQPATFQRASVKTNAVVSVVDVNVACDPDGCADALPPQPTDVRRPATAADASEGLNLTVRLFKVGTTQVEVQPCGECGAGEFAIDPLSSYNAVVATRGIPDLRPIGSTPLYAESSISNLGASFGITGKTQATYVRCTDAHFFDPNPDDQNPGTWTCHERTTYRPYLALTYARLIIEQNKVTLGGTTAPTATLPSRQPGNLEQPRRNPDPITWCARENTGVSGGLPVLPADTDGDQPNPPTCP